LKTNRNRYFETLNADAFNNIFKVLSVLQNSVDPAGTKEVEPENIVKVFKHQPQTKLRSILANPYKKNNSDILYEMGP